LDRAASLFDRRDGRLRCAVNFESDLRLQFAGAEQTHTILGATQNAGSNQRLDIHDRLGVELARIDSGLHLAQIHLIEAGAEDIVEGARGQPAMRGHLAAFEALDAHARTRGLALAATAAGLALAGADATADAHALLACARIVGEISELHRPVSFVTCYRGRARDARPWRSCPAPTAYPAVRSRVRSC